MVRTEQRLVVIDRTREASTELYVHRTRIRPQPPTKE